MPTQNIYPLRQEPNPPAYMELTVFNKKITYVRLVWLDKDEIITDDLSAEKAEKSFNMLVNLMYEHFETERYRHSRNSDGDAWTVTCKKGEFGGMDFTFTHSDYFFSPDHFFGVILDRPYTEPQRTNWIKNYT